MRLIRPYPTDADYFQELISDHDMVVENPDHDMVVENPDHDMVVENPDHDMVAFADAVAETAVHQADAADWLDGLYMEWYDEDDEAPDLFIDLLLEWDVNDEEGTWPRWDSYNQLFVKTVVPRERVALPDEVVVRDSSGDLTVSVPCQNERHLIRLTSRGQLAFDHHNDISALMAAGEAACRAQRPQLIRCGEILVVWRHWQNMPTLFPGASRAFGLPAPLIELRAKAFRLRNDRLRWRESEKRRAHRERFASINRVSQRLLEKKR